MIRLHLSSKGLSPRIPLSYDRTFPELSSPISREADVAAVPLTVVFAELFAPEPRFVIVVSLPSSEPVSTMPSKVTTVVLSWIPREGSATTG